MKDVMTDILGTESLLGSAPSILPPVAGVDASAVDKNLRALAHVESAWRLPGLPDDVRLDLASSPGMSPDALGSFMYGLEKDLYNEQDEDLTAVEPMPQLSVVGSQGEFGQMAVSGFQDANAIISSLRSLPPSEALDGDAVQRWKLRAIERGFMEAPEDGVIDGTWSPELYGVQRQMQFDEYDSSLRGDRPGATTFGNAMKLIGDWTSPSGLLRMATELDLFWDVGQISNEFDDWGDKWRKLGDSDNPLDFAKNLFDAVTGPVDDIVIPVLNMALLFTGVGSAMNFGRLAITGARAYEASQSLSWLNRLYEVPKVGSFLSKAMGAGDFAKLGDASWTAQKFVASQSAALNFVGGKMAAWRALPQVIGARGLTQTGMRLGFVSGVENRLLPNYQGSGSLASVPLVANVTDKALSNPWITTVGETLFTPYTIFDPGTFINGGRTAVSGAFRFLGTAPGRATAGAVIGGGIASLGDADGGDVLEGAAIGAGVGAAAPGIGKALDRFGQFGGHKVPYLSAVLHGAAKPLRMTSWEPIANDQRITQVYMDAFRAKLPPEEYGAFDSSVRERGFIRTFSDMIGTDEKGVGAAMAHVTVSAAIDRTAALQSGAVGSKGQQARYWLARNKLTSQLRVFDENTTKSDVVWAIVSKEAGGAAGRRNRYDKLMTAIDEQPERFAEVLANHNEQAHMTMRQLLSPENLPLTKFDETSLSNLGIRPGVEGGFGEGYYESLTKYVANSLDSFGRWGTYQPLTGDLGRLIQKGDFDEMALAPVVSYMGKRGKLNLVENMPEWRPLIDESMMANFSVHSNDLMFLDQGVSLEQARKAGFMVNPLASEIDPTRNRITLALKDTPMKGEYMAAADELQRTLDVMKDMERVSRIKGIQGYVPGDVGAVSVWDRLGMSSMSVEEVDQTMKALSIGGKSRSSIQKVHQFVQHMKAEGIDVDRNFSLAFNEFAQQLGRDARWARYKQAEHVVGEDGKVLSGLDLVQHRLKGLREQARYTAAEVDHEDLIAKLAAKGGTSSDEMRAYMDHVDAAGYKVVYGADFLMPDELLNRTGLFGDINERHMNAMTLGNFFGRRSNEVLALNVQMARQRSIAKHLGEVTGKSMMPDDAQVTEVLGHLYREVLDPELMRNASMVEDLHHQTISEKIGTALRTSKQPQSMQDLGLGSSRSRVTAALEQLGYGKKEAAAVWTGLKEARYAEFRDLGLYSLEAKLRGRSQFIDALHILGGSENASVLKRAVGGAVIGGVAGAVAGDDQGDVLTGAIAGAAGRAVGGEVTNRVVKAVDYTKWARYGYLADNLAAFRDRMRFSLSPFFDLSRYTEAFTLGQVAAPRRLADGSRMTLPLNQSPKALRRRLMDEFKDEAVVVGKLKENTSEFIKASRGQFDPGELESTARWFSSTGMFGFNPTTWMESGFYHMRQQGMSAEAAYDAVREMHTYGTRARSAFEQSVNFVFFPFSFQKKTLSHMAGWMADDLSRAVLLHDAYKTYQLLDENYDLGQWADDHLPVLEKLQQLNMFAYGISPGRLGGVNAPYINEMIGDPTSMEPDKRGLILNLFSPVGVNVSKTGLTGQALQDMVRKTIPAINDINQMVEDLKSQGHVIFDASHQVRYAQSRDAYAEWSEYRKGVAAALKNVGSSWYDMANDPGMAPLNDQYKAKKLQLENKYPGWNEAKLAGMNRKAENDLEAEHRRNTVAYQPQEATLSDIQFVAFEQQLNGLLEVAKPYGVSGIEDLPPEEFARLRGVASSYLQGNPNFLLVYNRFWQRELGPLMSRIVQ